MRFIAWIRSAIASERSFFWRVRSDEPAPDLDRDVAQERAIIAEMSRRAATNDSLRNLARRPPAPRRTTLRRGNDGWRAGW